MLKWALIFFIISIVAAFFGFFGLATAVAGIAKVLFYLFLACAVIMLIIGLTAARNLTR